MPLQGRECSAVAFVHFLQSESPHICCQWQRAGNRLADKGLRLSGRDDIVVRTVLVQVGLDAARLPHPPPGAVQLDCIPPLVDLRQDAPIEETSCIAQGLGFGKTAVHKKKNGDDTATKADSLGFSFCIDGLTIACGGYPSRL